MQIQTTNGITVQVENHYLIGESSVDQKRYCHAYRITIVNESAKRVKLLSRHWIIKDGDGETREVQGDGVVGQQPELMPGASHQYVSWCPLRTPIGSMSGSYRMMDLDTQETFLVMVPRFQLNYPPKLN